MFRRRHPVHLRLHFDDADYPVRPTTATVTRSARITTATTPMVPPPPSTRAKAPNAETRIRIRNQSRKSRGQRQLQFYTRRLFPLPRQFRRLPRLLCSIDRDLPPWFQRCDDFPLRFSLDPASQNTRRVAVHFVFCLRRIAFAVKQLPNSLVPSCFETIHCACARARIVHRVARVVAAARRDAPPMGRFACLSPPADPSPTPTRCRRLTQRRHRGSDASSRGGGEQSRYVDRFCSIAHTHARAHAHTRTRAPSPCTSQHHSLRSTAQPTD